MRVFIWFVLGAVVALGGLVLGGYVFLRNGGVAMETTASPLPLERAVARIALRASIGSAEDTPNPLPATDAALLAAVRDYGEHCAVCHGRPGGQPTSIALGMFPPPPQLFDPKDMITEDPQGETYWKITHGIRLSGMPGFGKTLSDAARWQLAMLLARADKLPAAAAAALASPRQ